MFFNSMDLDPPPPAPAIKEKSMLGWASLRLLRRHVFSCFSKSHGRDRQESVHHPPGDRGFSGLPTEDVEELALWPSLSLSASPKIGLHGPLTTHESDTDCPLPSEKACLLVLSLVISLTFLVAHLNINF